MRVLHSADLHVRIGVSGRSEHSWRPRTRHKMANSNISNIRLNNKNKIVRNITITITSQSYSDKKSFHLSHLSHLLNTRKAGVGKCIPLEVKLSSQTALYMPSLTWRLLMFILFSRHLSPTLSDLHTKISWSPRQSAWIWPRSARGSRTASFPSWIQSLRTMKIVVDSEYWISVFYYVQWLTLHNLACFIAAEINNLSVSAIFFYPVRLYFLLIKLGELGTKGLFQVKSLLIQIYLL